MFKIIFRIIISVFINELHAEVDRSQELMKLITQEMKLLEKTVNKGPELQYRMLELQSEKLKLIHEKDNQNFLQKSKTTSVNHSKESFFRPTRSYYELTKGYGQKILKSFPDTRRRPEILFALALNSRDYGKDNLTEKYLLETISLVKDPAHSLRHHAETALADFYYNEKSYPEAVHYYERVIQKTQDDWLTKHYFNLSWCYLKSKDFNRAISAIKEAYTLSKNKNYVSVRDQVLDNIGSFYVYAGRPLEGLEFYLKNENDPLPYLIQMSKKTSEKGHQTETQTILDAAQELVRNNKLDQYQEELYHTYLDFYRHYNRFEDFNKTSLSMVRYYELAKTDKKVKRSIDLKADAVEKVRSLAGFLQVKLAKNMKEVGGSYKEDELKLVLSFLDQLKILDEHKRSEYYYFQGETYYSVKRFLEAAPAYQASLREAKFVKDLEMARKALNSLLALTSLEVIDEKQNKSYLIFAFSEYVQLWARDEKSELIYPKLFEIFRQNGQDEDAAKVVKAFHQAYPEHVKEQQVLTTKILDLYIEKKETRKFADWIHQFRSGYLSFSKDTIEKMEITLGNMLFLEYQDLAKKGEKMAAAKGFESIYVNKLYTNKVKSQSAYFASLTYLEVSKTEESFDWQKRAVELMTPEERSSKRSEQLQMTERTYRLQDFVTSFKMASFFLDYHCSQKDKIEDRFFEIAVMTALVDENADGAENTMRQNSSCLSNQSLREVAIEQLYKFYERRDDFRRLRLHVHRYHSEKLNAEYVLTLQKWFWKTTSLNLKELISQEFKSMKNPQVIAWMNEYSHFKGALIQSDEIVKFNYWSQDKFDSQSYNRSLESFLGRLQVFKKANENLLKSEQWDLAILSTKLFAKTYQAVGERIRTMNPKGLDPQMAKDFQKAMLSLGDQLISQASQFERQLVKASTGDEHFSSGLRKIATVEDIENPILSFANGLTMDAEKGE